MTLTKISFLITVGLVCLAFHPLREDGVDPLLVEVNGISGYQMSHFAMFFVVGYVNFFSLAEVVGVSFLWELTEFSIGRATNEVQHWTSGGVHGQLTDISLNISGYLWGLYLGRIIPCSLTNCQSRLVKGYSSSAVGLVLLAYIISLNNL